MMRGRIVGMLLWTACGSTAAPPAPPANRAATGASVQYARPRLDGLTDEQRCAATEPRGTECADSSIAADIAMTDLDPEAKEALTSEARKGPPTGRAGRKKMHETRCLADDDYPFAVAACWNEATCDVLAKCVVRETERRRTTHRSD